MLSWRPIGGGSRVRESMHFGDFLILQALSSANGCERACTLALSRCKVRALSQCIALLSTCTTCTYIHSAHIPTVWGEGGPVSVRTKWRWRQSIRRRAACRMLAIERLWLKRGREALRAADLPVPKRKSGPSWEVLQPYLRRAREARRRRICLIAGRRVDRRHVRRARPSLPPADHPTHS